MSELWTRRRWIQSAALTGAGLCVARLASAGSTLRNDGGERAIELFNTHTNESLDVVYKRNGVFDAGALGALENLLRDHRNGATHPIDPGLYDQLFELAHAAHCKVRFEVISGYRSPESNAKMSSAPGSGVAKKSLHMSGRAMDVRLRGCDCADLRNLAISAARGGVGYYQRSNFVHVDTGSFRTWVG